jgi:uncharacterized protein YaaW (UPF0174 family)
LVVATKESGRTDYDRYLKALQRYVVIRCSFPEPKHFGTKGPMSGDELDLYRSVNSLAEIGTPTLALIEDDEDLVPLLRQASKEELAPLVAIIIEKGGMTAELPQTWRYVNNAPNHRIYVDDIAAEIQKYGANSIATWFRKGRGKPYREILTNIAKKSRIKVREKDKVEDIELRLIHSVLGRAWQHMSTAERNDMIASIKVHGITGADAATATMTFQGLIRLGGFTPYKLAVIAANGAVNTLTSTSLSLGANAALTKTISIFAGPICWVISALWFATAVAGPEYEVVLPCILQVALIRQAAIARERDGKHVEWFWIGMILVATALLILIGMVFANR